MKTAAIYTRVSSERQKEEHTIGSQVEALVNHAKAQNYSVPEEWIFQDEGYSGAVLVRPGLERLRDLAAEGQIDTVLVYSPDRLSRKYAYQVLLIEEFSRQGVDVVFLRSPKAKTPEDELLLQFQGMIAEYERAQIVERTRRGKRHRAHQGSVNVLSGAPYGYRYIKKTDTADAFYEVIDTQADTVREIFRLYTKKGLSINAIARWLNDHDIPTRSGTTRWRRSVVWAILRNPAYRGMACFGKTEQAERQKITRPLRQRGGFSPRDSANRERPREQWIEIPVPALITEKTFARAQELLEQNKNRSPRRTKEPTLLQGMLVCDDCGYAYYRTSTRTSKHHLHYYRCLGSDDYRYAEGRVCQNRPIRQDYLDELVWQHVSELFDNPEIIQAEIARRIEAAKRSAPGKRRQETIGKELTRVRNGAARLLDAYQDGLMALDELRTRMPPLRKREQALSGELEALEDVTAAEDKYLRLADTMADFRARVKKSSNQLGVIERQKVLRLVVKEVLVGQHTVRIKHSIPFREPRGPGGSGSTDSKSYLLRSGSHFTVPGQCISAPCTG